jgi:hypothetical protein
MLARLGDVLYWGTSGLAVLIVFFIAWAVWAAQTTDYVLVFLAAAFAALVWAVGRACRYVLAGR